MALLKIIKPGDDLYLLARGIRAIGKARVNGFFEKASRQRSEEVRAAEWFMIDSLKAAAERRFTAQVFRFFNYQERVVLKNLKSRKKDALDIVTGIFDIEFWYNETIKRFGPEIAASTLQGFKIGLSRLDAVADFNPDNPLVRAILDEVLSKTKGINDTVKDELINKVQGAIEAGAEPDSIIDAVRKSFDVSRSRAATIARTAYTPGFEQGQVIAYGDAGVTKKGWLSQRDGKVRTGVYDHLAPDAENQIVALDQTFSVSGEDLRFPGDPSGSAGNVINCRCQTEPRLD